MGENLIVYYKEKIPKSLKIAFYSTLIIGLFAHFYKFSNTLLNHDSVYNFYSNQNVMGSGRWFLSLACGISSYFDLPWINGILSILYIAISMMIIVKLFEIKNPVLIILCSGLLVTSPSITETFFFEFTADGYMLALLFSSIAVYLSRINQNNLLLNCISCLLLCLSCGIYQAYVSFALVLAILYFSYELFQNRYSKNEYLDWIKRQVIIFIIALLVYYVIWKLCLFIFNIPVNNYQGIDKVGQINISMLFNGFIKSIKNILLYFLQWNVFEHGFSTYSVLNIIFFCTLVIGLGTTIKESEIYKNKLNFFLLVLCALAFIPFACMWNFVSDSVGYRPMMLTCLSLLFIFTAIIYEKYSNINTSNIIGLLMALIIFNNVIIANISYFYMELCNQKTYAESIEMMSDIRYLENDNEIEKIAIIGNNLEEVGLFNYDISNFKNRGQIHILSGGLEKTLLYDSEHVYLYLRNIHNLEYEKVLSNELKVLENDGRVISMRNWPSKDSIQVIDNILVIKLSDVEVE